MPNVYSVNSLVNSHVTAIPSFFWIYKVTIIREEMYCVISDYFSAYTLESVNRTVSKYFKTDSENILRGCFLSDQVYPLIKAALADERGFLILLCMWNFVTIRYISRSKQDQS